MVATESVNSMKPQGLFSAATCNYYLLTVLIVLHCGHGQQFAVQPVSVIQAEGLEAVFECLYPGASSYSWLIDGSSISLPPLPGIQLTDPSVDSPTARLNILATPQYNTVVQCEATVRTRVDPFVLSRNATLEVQGSLSPVLNLHFKSSNTFIIISWDPPFSMNLTTAEPDIQYCVDVYAVTEGEDDHLQSVCNIIYTNYTFTPSDTDQSFKFTVTPRSNVKGSLNGTTSEPVLGSLIQEPAVIDSWTSDSEVEVITPEPQPPGNRSTILAIIATLSAITLVVVLAVILMIQFVILRNKMLRNVQCDTRKDDSAPSSEIAPKSQVNSNGNSTQSSFIGKLRVKDAQQQELY